MKKEQLVFPFLALIAVVTLYFSTHWGPGVGGDATIYITSARNLISGKGLGLIEPGGEFRLLPYFAPFFPLVLSFFGLAGANLVEAARWLNILLFGGLVWLAGSATLRLTRSWLLALLAALLLAGSPILIPIFSWAMSEPLALFLGFAGLWLALAAMRKEKLGLLFFGSAVLTGLSLLTRYSSAAFVMAAAAGLVLFQTGGRRIIGRLSTGILYAAVATAPAAVWLWIDYRLTATVSSRSVESAQSMLPRLAAFWPQVQTVVLTWLVPFSWMDAPRYPALINRLLPVLMGLVVLIWALWLAGAAQKRRVGLSWNDDRIRWAALLGLLVVSYTAVILAVYVTTYPPITIDSRMLSPLYIAFFWLVVTLASLTPPVLTAARSQQVSRALLGVSLALMAAWFSWRSLRIVQVNYQTGLGYTAPAWRSSPTLAAVRALPPGTQLVTNEQTALLFLADLRAYPLMEIYQEQPSSVFTRYGEGDLAKDDGQRLFHDGQADLVLFDSINGQMESIYGPSTSERVTALIQGLRPVFQGEDGGIYHSP